MYSGVTVKKARENMGWSVKELAKKADLSVSTIYRVELGGRYHLLGHCSTHQKIAMAFTDAIAEREAVAL